MKNWLGLTAAIILLSGCVTPIVCIPDPVGATESRHLAVFFDGTNNEPGTPTNVVKLHNLVHAQGRADILTFYVEGVGVGSKLIGSGTGWGIDDRVQKAYDFLIENHRAGDKIHIFGFSRGAYSARILAALLEYGGLPQRAAQIEGLCRQPEGLISLRESVLEKSPYEKVSQLIYAAYKGEMTGDARRKAVRQALAAEGIVEFERTTVTTLGLWDTVEALGFVESWEGFKEMLGATVPNDVDERNKRYGDQLCNVTQGLHALSIDDNRADAFTPKLLTRRHLYANCRPAGTPHGSDDFSNVEEVWFAGAHSDVGGGYDDCESDLRCISNVSLGWMVNRLQAKSDGLLTTAPALSGDVLGKTHDPRNASFWSKLGYHEQAREPFRYATEQASVVRRPKIHYSVIERLAARKPGRHEYGWAAQRAACFKDTGSGLSYVGSESPHAACTDPALRATVEKCGFDVVK